MPIALGRSTFAMNRPPSILSSAAVGGKKEGEGPMAQWFDEIQNDTTFGEKTWEKAESRFQQRACELALKKQKWHRNRSNCCWPETCSTSASALLTE